MVTILLDYTQFNYTDISTGLQQYCEVILCKLILLGLMIGALFNAPLYMLVLMQPRKMNSIVNYLFGGFASAEYHDVVIIAVTLSIAIVILFSMQKH